MQTYQTDLRRIQTSVLLNMIRAHSAYYYRILTEGELSAAAKTITELQMEIDSRRQAITAGSPGFSLIA